MVNASLLPFPATSGAGTSLRPPSPTASNRDDFSGAMDEALGTRATRRADSGSRTSARRSEPARARETDAPEPLAPARKVDTSKPAARTERPEASTDDNAVERKADTPSNDTAVATDQPETAPEVKAEGAAVAQGGDQASGESAGDAVAEAAVIGDAIPIVGDVEGESHAATGAVEGGDPLARGRRWAAPADDAEGAPEELNPNGVPWSRSKGIAGPGLKVGHAIQQARAEGGAAPGEALAQVAKDIVAPAHAEADAETAANEPVTQALETAAAKPQTSSAASAASAVEMTASLVETAAAVEPTADTHGGESPAQEHAQARPQTPNALPNPGTVVAVSGMDGGAKFTVNSAAGNAAYASAAPRAEEAVLPQIVQSIRLQAVQGTTEARVQLKPEHLGNLNITLKVEHNQVTATIQADVAAVRQWIESHEATLRQSLSEQGLQLARLEVHPDGEQPSRDEQGSDQARRQQRRRSWRGDDATFEVLA